ncbi:hypothetical protein [Luteolibacter sp. AS25]|uniref:hypothetical protein n=1 Tax=Luteolibacter sp. AS25 TaxID=3135776 RepID=UPI00398B4506
MKIAISGYNELRCLHLTLCEAKFHAEPDRKEIQGSSFVADTANKVFDMLIEEAPSDKVAEDWKSHRVLQPNSMILPAIRTRCDEWFRANSLTREEKIEFIKDVAAPYSLTDPLISVILGDP